MSTYAFSLKFMETLLNEFALKWFHSEWSSKKGERMREKAEKEQLKLKENNIITYK